MTSRQPESESAATPESLLDLAFPSDPQISPDGTRVAFVLSRVEEEDVHKPEADWARPRYKSQIWLSSGEQAQAFTQGEARDAAPRWSPDGATLAFVRDSNGRKGQLHLLPLNGGEARRVTDFRQPVQDVQWSPDGRFISFLSTGDDEDKRDERGEARVITRPRYRFNGRDWLPERAARLWLYDVAQDDLTEWHAPAVEITSVAWLPGSDGVLFVSSVDEFSATQWQSEVYRLPLSGEAAQITHWNASISTVIPHPDGERFALVGRPEGQGNTQHAHLYLLHPNGEFTRLDEGHDHPVGNLVGGDCHVGALPDRPVWLDASTILFSSTVRGSCGLFTATLGGQVQAHTHDPEAVIPAFTARGGGVAVIRETATRFPEVELSGQLVTDLNARLAFPARAPQRVTFQTDLGEGEGWVLLPDGHAPAPALLSIHGGPHTDYGHAFTHEFQLLAARGYGVCYSNPRGSVGYGQAWVDDIHGRWGTVDMADLLAFFDRCLEAHPVLDASRTAVMGGSYGGFMTNWITAHTDRFQAAVTDRSICNLISFGGTSDIGLRFWDDELGLNFHRRADVPKLWDMSPLQYVENVRTPTLIVHSVLDHRCPIEQAEQWYAALTLHGVPTRFVRFPGEDHELSRSGRPDRRLTRLHEYLNWLDRWLGKAPDAAASPEVTAATA
ncbi:S9 family peptidase [Deinococcus deserti]|uniref:Putative dipeptidyl aminopeptidase/acylaminoacyl-peptidase n=1 Tax=Deinococcus deserti (strain DSM 17065 / CIP 109153 / LMG 22923 / VCD115) TaxID=546414 RepID=C1CY45_DEIDV|nr:S9 family peptidase [Deinococcus deserti]ACO47001.1 putative dipeptidyl aminopeptidase/acylaminoacyl-peptidase [Deinococcus deserti VCD115]